MENEQRVFVTSDQIVPMLKFADPTPIRIEITEKYVYLYVGQRDWQWDKKTGRLVGTGTGQRRSRAARNRSGRRKTTLP